MFDKKEDCEGCEDTAHVGEIAMGVLGVIAGLFVVAFSLDLLSGGMLSRRLDAIGGAVVADEEVGEVNADE